MFRNKKNKELIKYLIVGISTVFIDFIVYKLLIKFIAIYLSKTFSFLCGTLWSYQFNRTWTFKYGNPKISQFVKYLIIHITSLFLNVSINSTLLKTFYSNFSWSYSFSFFSATIVSAVYNFLCIKIFIFNNQNRKS